VQAGAAILPAALAMVLVAPRSAKLVASHGSRATLLTGYVFLVGAFVGMLLLWNEDTPYWQIALPYIFIGIGVGLAGTPASNSLTGSVPVRRVGMASGTADLQRDLGGALMTSILGSVLTTHYASAMAGQSVSDEVSSSTESQLQLSFASAENIAAHYPEDADAIIAAAKSSFLDGDQWAYGAGLVSVLVGAVLVFFVFPRREREDELRASYHAADTARA
jgi:MFS family permease